MKALHSTMAGLLPMIWLALAVAGCESQQDHLALAEVTHTPLALDPTQTLELSTWWSNGSQMMRLDEAGSYALFGTVNRYRTPIERGHWSHERYFEVVLSPYDAGPATTRRIGVQRAGDELVLRFDGLAPMHAIEAPPRVMEDELLGTWTAEQGTLEVRERRYAFASAPLSASGRALIVGHEGNWRLDAGTLVLEPDPPNLGPYAFLVEEEQGVTTLSSDRMVFLRK